MPPILALIAVYFDSRTFSDLINDDPRPMLPSGCFDLMVNLEELYGSVHFFYISKLVLFDQGPS